MPRGSYMGRVYSQCPFYKYDERSKNKIVCEGIVEDSTVALTYQLRKDYENQLEVFCCEHYKKCEVYRMLMAKYEED